MPLNQFMKIKSLFDALMIKIKNYFLFNYVTEQSQKKPVKLIKSRCGRMFLVMSSCVTQQCVRQREQSNHSDLNHHTRGFTQDASHKLSINVISADQFTVSIVIINVSGWLRPKMGIHTRYRIKQQSKTRHCDDNGWPLKIIFACFSCNCYRFGTPCYIIFSPI